MEFHSRTVDQPASARLRTVDADDSSLSLVMFNNIYVYRETRRLSRWILNIDLELRIDRSQKRSSNSRLFGVN
jgi:hypothetical protein